MLRLSTQLQVNSKNIYRTSAPEFIVKYTGRQAQTAHVIRIPSDLDTFEQFDMGSFTFPL